MALVRGLTPALIEPAPQSRQLPTQVVDLLLHPGPFRPRPALARPEIPTTHRSTRTIPTPPRALPEQALIFLEFPGQTFRHGMQPRRVKMMNGLPQVLKSLPGGNRLVTPFDATFRTPRGTTASLPLTADGRVHRGTHPLPLHPDFHPPFDATLRTVLSTTFGTPFRTALRTGAGPIRSMGFTG